MDDVAKGGGQLAGMVVLIVAALIKYLFFR